MDTQFYSQNNYKMSLSRSNETSVIEMAIRGCFQYLTKK
jgi:hypothetical protein